MKQQYRLLPVEERDSIMQMLTEEQKQFLEERMKRGRRTQFARQMAERKGAVIPENATFEDIESLLSDWIYVGYTDSGAINPETPCECGRPLRYRHTVENKATGEIRQFGIDHLELHTGIDAKTVQAIMKGFNIIDFELSELLIKVSEGWKLQNAVRDLPDGLVLPSSAREHLELGLPLLDRQIARLHALVREHLDRTPRSAAGSGKTAERSAPRLSAAPETVAPHAAASASNDGFQQLDLFAGAGSEQLSFDFFAPPAAPQAPSPANAAERTAAGGGSSDLLQAIYGGGNSSPAAAGESKLTDRQREAVRRYLREGVSSARIICELLIKNDGASDSRYVTHKPIIYAPVCLVIEEQVAEGVLKLVSKDETDRLYERTDG